MFDKLIKSQNGKIVSKLMAVMIVITLTFTNFIFLFSSMYKGIVSYAQEIDLSNQNNKTNDENVLFDVYLSNANTSVNEITSDMNSNDVKLYISINVQNGGYLQGTEVELVDTNFRIKNNPNVTKFSLGQIQSGSAMTQEIPVVALKEDAFNVSLLNKVSQIKLTSTYINNEGKEIQIDTTKGIKINWTAEDIEEGNEPIQFSEEIITNKTYNINGENKKVVQTLVTSGITNNVYPINKTEIILNTPVLSENENTYPEEVIVNSTGTMATNGKSSIDFETQNWEYNSEEHTISITVQNVADENNNISWNKLENDKFIVTYIYPETTDVSNLGLKANSKITLYDVTNKVLTKEFVQTLENVEEKTGIFSLEAIPTNVVYKGNMKLGQETEFETIWKVGVNYTGLNAALQVSNTVDTLNIEGNEVSYYKETYINKAEFMKILGEQGILEIYNGETLVSKITGETETNEVGDFQINYEGNIETIRILTTAPINGGILNIRHKKVLKAQGDITNINLLTTNVKLESTETITDIGEMQIANTQTKIELGIENNRLSTTQVNNLNITVTLKTNDIKQSLYTNPSIQIILPQEIKEVNLEDDNIQVLNGNGLAFVSKSIEENNGYKVITIQLDGTQDEYNQANTQIAINMEVNTQDLLPSSEKTIYAKVINGEETQIKEDTVKLIAESGTLLAISASNYNGAVETKSLKSNLQTGALQVGLAEQTNVNIKGTIVNNNEEDILPIIVGKVSEESNIMATLNSLVRANNATIYYTQSENVNLESVWNETYIANSTGYKVVFNEKLAPASTNTFEYDVILPANLTTNKNIVFKYDIYNGINKLESPSITLSTPKEAKLDLSLESSVAQGETVYTGQELSYVIKIKNTGETLAENVAIQNVIPEGTTLISRDAILRNSIEIGETLTETIRIRVNDLGEMNQITNTVSVTANNLLNQVSGSITNPVETSPIDVIVSDVYNDGGVNYENGQMGYKAEIKNISKASLTNFKIICNIPEETTYSRDFSEVVIIEAGHEVEEEYLGTVVEKQIDKEIKDNKIIYTISELKSGEILRLGTYLTANKFEENVYEKNISYEFEIEADEMKKYNVQENTTIIKPNIQVEFTSVNTTNNDRKEYVEENDVINYTAHITNKTNSTQNTIIKGEISEGLEVSKITYRKNGNMADNMEDTKGLETGEASNTELYLNEGTYDLLVELGKDESIVINIEAKVGEFEETKEDIVLSNTVNAFVQIPDREGFDEEVYSGEKTETIQYKIKGINVEEPTNPENPQNPENPVEKTYKISGVAWLDENEDGKINENEQKMKDIVVKLINATTNEYVKKDGEILQTKTNELGQYEFSELPVGNYIVIFEYNQTTYRLTKANVESVAVITTTSEGNVVKTNAIEITNKDISNINIGLVLNPEFDLQLDKYISKVTVQNNTGSTAYNYENVQLAKIEIPAKNIKGSTIIIEYEIKVTNNGAVPGYAKNIVDYLSEELSFNSELNTNWYQDKDKNLYCVELANTEIQPGESKEVKLILTKTMPDDATILINNTAEIYEDYNEYALQDINSTPANTEEKENDMSPADILITIKTGGPVLYIGIVLVSMLILGGGIYLINKKVLLKNLI